MRTARNLQYPEGALYTEEEEEEHMGCVTSRELHCDVKILILDDETSIPNAEKSLALTHFIKLISVDGGYTTITLC